MKTTVKDVHGAFDRLKEAAAGAGIDTSRWQLSEGSLTYGRAWKLYERAQDTGALFETELPCFLGMTKEEAYRTLHSYAAGIWAAVREASKRVECYRA